MYIYIYTCVYIHVCIDIYIYMYIYVMGKATPFPQDIPRDVTEFCGQVIPPRNFAGLPHATLCGSGGPAA